MPTYEYCCFICGNFVYKRKMLDDPKEEVCNCGFLMKIMPSNNILEPHLSGWANTVKPPEKKD